MTVRDLEKLLAKIKDKSRLVILQEDPEGNGYRRVMGVDSNSRYLSSDDVRFETLTPELEARGFTEEDCCSDNGVPAVIIYP